MSSLPRFRLDPPPNPFQEGVVSLTSPEGEALEVRCVLTPHAYSACVAACLTHGLAEGATLWLAARAELDPLEAEAELRASWRTFALEVSLTSGQRVVLRAARPAWAGTEPWPSGHWQICPAAEPRRPLTTDELRAAWEALGNGKRFPWPWGPDGSFFFKLQILRMLGADFSAAVTSLDREVLTLLSQDLP